MIKTIVTIAKNKWARQSSDSLITYYRNKGIVIGQGCVFRSPGSTHIDIMRPSLVSIGNNIYFGVNVTV